MSILFSRRRALALVLAFVLAVTATIVPAAPKRAEARACPAVAVIAARGSGQPNIGRTSYAQSPWVSNGWEGEHIRAFLRTSENRYRATHGGKSLMNSVEVLGLGPEYYPAFAPEYHGTVPALPRTLAQTLNLVGIYALPLFNMGVQAARDFISSVGTGRAGVILSLIHI